MERENRREKHGRNETLGQRRAWYILGSSAVTSIGDAAQPYLMARILSVGYNKIPTMGGNLLANHPSFLIVADLSRMQVFNNTFDSYPNTIVQCGAREAFSLTRNEAHP